MQSFYIQHTYYMLNLHFTFQMRFPTFNLEDSIIFVVALDNSNFKISLPNKVMTNYKALIQGSNTKSNTNYSRLL